VKLPKGEQPDPSGQFQERMLFVETLVSVFLGLFDRFLDQRKSPAQWKKTVESMTQWVGRRAGYDAD
jgi:hypothetical protein